MSLQAPLRPFGRLDVFAPTGEESAAFDRRAIEELGVPQPVLMENAGRSAAQVAQRLFPRGPVVGFVGAGNNGGDALVLLRTLAAWGRNVKAVLVADRPRPEPLLHGWSVPTTTDADLGDRDEAWDALLDPAGLVVDGMLGTGVRGAPRERQARVIRRIARSGRPVLAIDIPSGVDAATGGVAGEAVQADVTVAFGAPKLGTLVHPGRAHVGRLVAVEIAFPPMDPGASGARVVTPAWAQARLPRRGPDTHKNAVGRLVVVAGKPGMAGAAVMSVRAGLRAGAGLVQVCSAPENRVVLQSAVPEAIFVDAEDAGALDDALDQANAVAAGPGLGTDARAKALLSRVLEGRSVPTVLDADALNLVAAGEVPPPEAVAAARPLLMTPHPGEMGRLLTLLGEEIGPERPRIVTETALRWGCAVLLKGAPSLVSDKGGPALVDTLGSSDLAVAGMGDVLTGVTGGLLAQGLEPAEAGSVGLYLTGRAAVLSERGKALTPSDVVQWLPTALAERGDGETDLDFPFLVFDQDPAR
jgi:NAD(P)H-hydrate epimerase